MLVCQDYFIWIYIVFWQGPFLKAGIDNLSVLSGSGSDSFYCTKAIIGKKLSKFSYLLFYLNQTPSCIFQCVYIVKVKY